MTVAMAAPATPMSNRKMNTGSSTMLVTAPASWVTMEAFVLPEAWSMRSMVIAPKRPKEQVHTMVRYTVPWRTSSASLEKSRRKGPARNRPTTTNSSHPQPSTNRPFIAARRASGPFFSPRRRLMTLFTPVPMPVDSATISICRG